MYYFLKNGLDSNSNDADTFFVYWLTALALLWTIRGIHHTVPQNYAPPSAQNFFLLTLHSSYQKQNHGEHHSDDRVLGRALPNKSHNFTLKMPKMAHMSVSLKAHHNQAHTHTHKAFSSMHLCAVLYSSCIMVYYQCLLQTKQGPGSKWFCFLCLHSCR